MHNQESYEIFGKHTAKRPRFLLIDPCAHLLAEYKMLFQDATGWGIKRLRVNNNDYCAHQIKGYWLIADNGTEALMMFQLKYSQCVLTSLSCDEIYLCLKLAKLREKRAISSPKKGRKKKSIMDYMYTMAAIALTQNLPTTVMDDPNG